MSAGSGVPSRYSTASAAAPMSSPVSGVRRPRMVCRSRSPFTATEATGNRRPRLGLGRRTAHPRPLGGPVGEVGFGPVPDEPVQRPGQRRRRHHPAHARIPIAGADQFAQRADGGAVSGEVVDGQIDVRTPWHGPYGGHGRSPAQAGRIGLRLQVRPVVQRLHLGQCGRGRGLQPTGVDLAADGETPAVDRLVEAARRQPESVVALLQRIGRVADRRPGHRPTSGTRSRSRSASDAGVAQSKTSWTRTSWPVRRLIRVASRIAVSESPPASKKSVAGAAWDSPARQPTGGRALRADRQRTVRSPWPPPVA